MIQLRNRLGWFEGCGSEGPSPVGYQQLICLSQFVQQHASTIQTFGLLGIAGAAHMSQTTTYYDICQAMHYRYLSIRSKQKLPFAFRGSVAHLAACPDDCPFPPSASWSPSHPFPRPA